MDRKNFKDRTFNELPEKVSCSNFTNCTFNAYTLFDRCNLRDCTFNVECDFDKSNVIDSEEEAKMFSNCDEAADNVE